MLKTILRNLCIGLLAFSITATVLAEPPGVPAAPQAKRESIPEGFGKTRGAWVPGQMKRNKWVQGHFVFYKKHSPKFWVSGHWEYHFKKDTWVWAWGHWDYGRH